MRSASTLHDGLVLPDDATAACRFVLPRPYRAASRWRTSLLILVGLGGVSSSAAAQTATALERFEPAPAADEFVAVPSAAVPGELRSGFGFALSFAKSPLTLLRLRGDDQEEIGDVVDYQLVLHNLLSVELFRRLKVEVDVPVTLSQDGEAPGYGAVQTASPSGAAMNDVRGGLRLELLRQDGWWPAAAVSLTGWVPTGDDEAYTSTGVARFAPAVVLGVSQTELAWGLTVGRRFEPPAADVTGLRGSELTFGAAVAAKLGPWQIGPEVYGSTVVEAGVPAFVQDTSSVEALLVARYDLGPLSFRLGGGPGLVPGIGTPTYRLIGSMVYVPLWPPAEGGEGGASETLGGRAGADHSDTTTGSGTGELAADGDGDSGSDAEDLCPTRRGDPSPTAPRRGCPADRDGDSVADGDDACPTVPGVRSSDPERDGCPGDLDGDGLLDPDDACPREKGERTDDPKTSGCPKLVKVVGEQIVILQQVHFATGSDVIDPTSEELLGQVAQLLEDRPEIARVAVDGHTDDVGPERDNIGLSQRRALSVVLWLNGQGVDARRTEARGFGPRRPIADNGTPEGRAKNRRVEFQILLRTEDGEAGWRDGPVH